jgi:hypothetical protein
MTTGRIDGLSFLGGLAATCSGSEDGITRFLFELCDFNLNGSLCKQEMVLMLKCSVDGLLKLLEKPMPDSLHSVGNNAEEIDSFVQLTNEAFDRLDSDNDGLSYNEFLEWARSNRVILTQLRKFNDKVSKIAESQPPTETAPMLPEEDAGLNDDYENECELHYVQTPFYKSCMADKGDVQENVSSIDISTQNWKATMIEMPFPTQFIIPPDSTSTTKASGSDKNKLGLTGSGSYLQNIKSELFSAPDCNLQLEWIHGKI